jgi:glycogen phosphorylase
MPTERFVAEASVGYFSMEIALEDALPSYCGGLGVLAGDHLRAAADLGLRVVGVTLLYRSGYFHQSFGPEGDQREEPVRWSPEDWLEPLEVSTSVVLAGRAVKVRPWCRWIVGRGGHRVPVLFLDTDVEGNDAADRAIADQLYGGSPEHRLRQEAILGLGGPPVLEQLGFELETFHMNEGHSSLLTLALLRADSGGTAATAARLDAVRRRCVFTTHTPVPEGHDRFPVTMVRALLGDESVTALRQLGGLVNRELNMTTLGMSSSRFANAVSMRHAEVTRAMFPDRTVRSITNGVHASRWVAPSVADLLGRFVPEWWRENSSLRYASAIPLPDLEEAHRVAKQSLIDLVEKETGVVLDPGALTLGAARRAAGYKRLDLLLSDLKRLRRIAETAGPLQIVCAGKAHPSDPGGKAVIVRIHEAAEKLKGAVAVAFLPDYSMDKAAVLCAGSDLWVNTPTKPQEASGTSGMKAAINGVPSLSVLDGWWLEGHVEGVTGWAVGDDSPKSDTRRETEDLYGKLESVIAPLFYGAPDRFSVVRRSAIALNGAYFTAERMVRQYAAFAYAEQPSSSVAPET